jgi:hypothetical protein
LHGTTDASPPHLHNLPHPSSSREIEIVRKHLSAAYISLLLKRKHLSAAFNTLSDLQRTLSPCAGTRRTDARALRRPRSVARAHSACLPSLRHGVAAWDTGTALDA